MGITLKGILSAVAPILAELLPGPLGGVVRKVLGEVIGKPGATDAEIEKAIVDADPALLLKLREAQDKFALEMKQKGIDLEKIAADDRANARGMQVATKSRVPAVLGAVVVIGWIGMLAYVMSGRIPSENREIVIQAVGTMNAALMMVLGFWYGTTANSAKKDETIAEVAKMP
jgi:hypothetical protein